MKIVVAAAIALLAAQEPTSPVFRATTDLVEVDVVVRDRAGALVTDLIAADFVVTEDGRPQTLEMASLVRSSGLSAKVWTDPVRRSRVFVVVFDEAHLSPAGFKRVQAAALALFEKEFDPGVDMGGVIAAGQMVNDRLTSASSDLTTAVRQAKPGVRRGVLDNELRAWPRLTEVEVFRVAAQDRTVIGVTVARACREEPERCGPPLGPQDAEDEVRLKAARLSSELRAESNATLALLSSLMTNLERLEGPKSVLLLTEGFVADESWEEVQQAVGLAAFANARIYSLDARGLTAAGRDVTERAPQEADSRMLEALGGGSDDALNSLAVDSGGYVVRDTSEFARAVGAIAQETGTYYILGYRPDRAPDGTLRKVAVSVNRKGLTARSRRAYVASPMLMPLVSASVANASRPTREPAPPLAADPAPLEASPEPHPLESTPIAPAAMGFAAGAQPTVGIRLRPLADEHVGELSSARRGDPAAAAGWAAYQRGDVESAREYLRQAAAEPTAAPWVHYALGMADFALQRYAEAVAEWENVRSTSAGFEPVYFDLVDGYLQLKDKRRATDVLRAAAERWPRDPDVFNALGVIHAGADSLDEAIAAFEQAARVAPDEPISYLNLGVVHERRYYGTLRYFAPTERWLVNERDREEANRNYERYLRTNGPYSYLARAGLARLKWAVPRR